jgi:nucleoside-diphosphate-sugar epimerase
MRGIDAVIHCAVGGRATTVDGTRKLLAAARAAGVRRVVHLSSIAVYGGAQGDVDETTPLVSPEGTGYAHWKAAAEAACLQAAATGLDVVVLRPAIVYGPGSEQWIVRPARRFRSGRWGDLGALAKGTCNPVHVADVADACAAALNCAAIGGADAYNISGPETITWRGWHARLAEALGYPPLPPISARAWRRRTMAALPLAAVARLLPPARGLLEDRILLAPARAELAVFGLAATYRTDKAASGVGWQPRIGLRQGLDDCVAWLRTEGLAPADPRLQGGTPTPDVNTNGFSLREGSSLSGS